MAGGNIRSTGISRAVVENLLGNARRCERETNGKLAVHPESDE